MATTTNRYLVYPVLAAGPTVTCGATAWVWTAWVELVPASTITATHYISAVSGLYDPEGAALDERHQFNVSLGTGGAGSEVEIWQGSGVYFKDSAHGAAAIFYAVLPEPKQVAANARIAVRVACSEARAAVTGGWKLQYQVP